jgi:hypothetical protein
MKNFVYIILSVLFLTSGCALYPLRYILVDNHNLASERHTEIVKLNDNHQNLSWQIDSKSEPLSAGGTFHVKYHPSYGTKRCIVIEGSIAGNKKKYPIVLDTGASQGVFVNDIHVLENNLLIYPVQTSGDIGRGYGLGRCYIPELRVGQMTLRDFTCWYLQRHLELKFFGLPAARDDSIIVGLTALREFSCIIFDNVKKEVEFSLDRAYEPEQERAWSKYPLFIEEDNHGNAFLFVQIPVAGQLMRVQLDTGSGNGLTISEGLWEKLSCKAGNVNLTEGTELYPYIGRINSKKGVIAQLQIGDRLISNAKISVVPAESPLLSDCDAILGMQYFQDTVIALDFKSSILWVEK